MTVHGALKQQWESAEIHRSGIEARLTSDSRLVADEENVRRYMNPPLDTPFPLEYAYALLGDVGGTTVLDFGCGSGENSLLLARRGARVIGVDISASLIELAKRRLQLNGVGGSRFVVGSAHDLPLRTESVDIVLGIAILHHLDLESTAREIHRVLKTGGRAIFQEPVRDSRLVRVLRKCVPYRAPDISPFERPLTSPELRRFSRSFASSTIRAFSLPFVNAAQAIVPLRRYLNSAYRYDYELLTRMPKLTVFSGIRVLQLTK